MNIGIYFRGGHAISIDWNEDLFKKLMAMFDSPPQVIEIKSSNENTLKFRSRDVVVVEKLVGEWLTEDEEKEATNLRKLDENVKPILHESEKPK